MGNKVYVLVTEHYSVERLVLDRDGKVKQPGNEQPRLPADFCLDHRNIDCFSDFALIRSFPESENKPAVLYIFQREAEPNTVTGLTFQEPAVKGETWKLLRFVNHYEVLAGICVLTQSAVSFRQNEDRSLGYTLVTGLGSFPVDWKGKVRQLPALGSPQPVIEKLIRRFCGLFD